MGNLRHFSVSTALFCLSAAFGVMLGCGSSDPTQEPPPKPAVAFGALPDRPDRGDALIWDSFDGAGLDDIELRVPEAGSLASPSWRIELGDWRVGDGAAIQVDPADLDMRATIFAEVSGRWVDADIVHESGSAGLVLRHRDRSDWVMAWSNGSQVIVASVVDDRFAEHGRVDLPNDHDPDEFRMSVIDYGHEIVVGLDGRIVMRTSVPSISSATSVGMFTRNSDANRFLHFSVWERP